MNTLIRDIHARSVKISASVYRTYYLRINITFVARYGWIRKERFLYIPEWIKIYIVYIYIYIQEQHDILLYEEQQRNTRIYIDITGYMDGRNEDSCCPCETKLQTAAKLVFPSLAGRPPLRVITRFKVFDATARKKARRIYI